MAINYLAQINSIKSVNQLVDAEGTITIDGLTRKIKVPVEFNRQVGMTGDHNSNIITFQCDRIIDGHDVSTCSMAAIKWQNTGSGADGAYTVADREVLESDNTKIKFHWLIESECTTAAGTLKFQVCFLDFNKSGTEVVYKWNSNTCAELTIGQGIFTEEIDEFPSQPGSGDAPSGSDYMIQSDLMTTDPEDPSYVKNNPFVYAPAEKLVEMTSDPNQDNPAVESLAAEAPTANETEQPYLYPAPMPNLSSWDETPQEWVPCVDYTFVDADPYPAEIPLTVGETVHLTCTSDQRTVEFTGKVKDALIPASMGGGQILYISDVGITEAETSDARFPDNLWLAPRTILFGKVVLPADANIPSDVSLLLLFIKSMDLATTDEASVPQLTNVKLTVTKGTGKLELPSDYVNLPEQVQADFTTIDPDDPSFIKNNPFVPSSSEILVEMTDIAPEDGDAPVVDVFPIPNITTTEETPSQWVPHVEYGLDNATRWSSKISLTVGETIYATCTCDQGTIDFKGRVKEVAIPAANGSILYISDVEVKESDIDITSADFPYTLVLAPRTVFFGIIKSEAEDDANPDFIMLFFKFTSLAADTEANVQQLTNVRIEIARNGTGTVILPAKYVDIDIPEQVQADFNATDSENPAYIKNNPFEVCYNTLVELDSLYLWWGTGGTPSQFGQEDFYEFAPNVYFVSSAKLPLQAGDTVRLICTCDQGETIDFTGIVKCSADGTLYVSDGDPFTEPLQNYKVFLDIAEDGGWDINFYFLDLKAKSSTNVVKITNPKVKIIKGDYDGLKSLPFKKVDIYDEISEQVAFTYSDAASDADNVANPENGPRFNLNHSSRQLDGGIWVPTIEIRSGTINIPEILTTYGEIIHAKCKCDQGVVEFTGKAKPVPVFPEGEGSSYGLYVSDIDIYNSDGVFSDRYQVAIEYGYIGFQFLDLAANTEAEVPELTNVVVTITKVTKQINQTLKNSLINMASVVILAADWTNKTAQKEVPGVTAANTIMVSPAPDSYLTYSRSAIRATQQADNSLTFACEEAPTEDVAVNIVIMP